MALIKSLGILLFVAVMASLVIDKVNELFPNIDTFGWVYLTIFFIIIGTIMIKVEPFVKRSNWKWVNRSEELRQLVLIFLIGFALGAILYLAWPLVGSYISPHFGEIH